VVGWARQSLSATVMQSAGQNMRRKRIWWGRRTVGENQSGRRQMKHWPKFPRKAHRFNAGQSGIHLGPANRRRIYNSPPTRDSRHTSSFRARQNPSSPRGQAVPSPSQLDVRLSPHMDVQRCTCPFLTSNIQPSCKFTQGTVSHLCSQ